MRVSGFSEFLNSFDFLPELDSLSQGDEFGAANCLRVRAGKDFLARDAYAPNGLGDPMVTMNHITDHHERQHRYGAFAQLPVARLVWAHQWTRFWFAVAIPLCNRSRASQQVRPSASRKANRHGSPERCRHHSGRMG
jgi:hypothetical protein